MTACQLETAHPPLRVWLAAGCLAATTVLALAILPTTHARRTDLNLARLEAIPSEAVHVVAIGSSITMRAFEFDDTFSRRLTTPKRPIVFHRVTWLGGAGIDIEPAFDALVRKPPDILIVESELLLVDKNPHPMSRSWLAPIEQALAAPWEPSSEIDRLDNRGVPRPWCVSQSPDDKFTERLVRWQPLDADVQARYVSAIRAVQRAGSRVILLDLPRSDAAAAVFPVQLAQQIESRRAALSSAEGFSLWAPGAPSQSAYCDASHLNDAGRLELSAWLAAGLRALLTESHV